MNIPVRTSFDFLGRLFLSTTFAVTIPPKILKFSLFVTAVENKGIPHPIAQILLVAAILCLIGGVVFLLFGKDQRIGASLLLVFLIPTTLVMHFFPFQSMPVFMNLGLIGGLLIALTRSNPSNNSFRKYSLEDFIHAIARLIKLDLRKTLD